MTKYGVTWENVAVEVQKRWDQADAAGTLQAPLVESDGEELEGWTRMTRRFGVSLKGGCLRWLRDTNHVSIYLYMSSSYVSMYYIFTRVILQIDHGNVYIQMFYGAAATITEDVEVPIGSNP